MMTKVCGLRPLSTVLWLACVATLGLANLQAQTDPRQEAESIRQKISEMASSIPGPEQIGRNPERDLETLAGFQAIKDHMAEIEKRYASEIATEQQPYRNLAGVIGYTREKITAVEQAAKNYASVQSVQADTEHILKMSAMAVQNQAPAFFRPENDIGVRTRAVESRIKMMQAIQVDAEQIKAAQKLAQEAAAFVKTTQTQLIDGIISQNQMPQDNYRMPDRDELLKLVRDTWTEKKAGGKILHIGLIGSNWNRTQAWEIQNRTLYKVDRSRIQGFVILDHDSKTVVCRNVQLQKDHTNNDKLSAWLISDPKSEPLPIELLLKSQLPKSN